MIKQIILTITFLLSFYHFAEAQIGGLSASKLNVFNAPTIDKGAFELEPTFGTLSSQSAWDENGISVDFSSKEIQSSLCWRATYGLLDNVEIGMNAPSDFSVATFATKVYLWGNENFQFGSFAGLTQPLGNRIYDPSNPSIDDLSTFAIGLAGTLELTEKSSVDFNYQVQDYFTSIQGSTEATQLYNFDFGVFTPDNYLLFIAGFSYQTSNGIKPSNKWSFFPGIAFEGHENFAVVVNGQFDFAGKNMAKTRGINFTFTTFLN